MLFFVNAFTIVVLVIVGLLFTLNESSYENIIAVKLDSCDSVIYEIEKSDC